MRRLQILGLLRTCLTGWGKRQRSKAKRQQFSRAAAIVERLEVRQVLTTHPLTDLPILNSHPGAPVNVYLDFDGHFQAVWERYRDIVTPAFSMDADVTTFSTEELAGIVDIFSRVAEDFAPFNINVTTVQPADLSNGHGLRVVIGGGSDDWFGSASGGFAFINSFTNNSPNLAYVFPEDLNHVDPTYIADACSHEAGHAFGLQHQSAYHPPNGPNYEYYDGDDTTAPLMGISYMKVRSRWWLGPTTSITTIQDDLAVLSRSENVFGYRPDDHGDDSLHATPIAFSGSRASAAGVIEKVDDTDAFTFTVDVAGAYRIDFEAAKAGANLDAHIQLRKADGTLIEDQTLFRVDQLRLRPNLQPGTYQILVQSDGAYGSLGQYSLEINSGSESSMPPLAVTNFEAYLAKEDSLVLNWTDTDGESGYELRTYRYGYTPVVFELPANTTTYTHNANWEFESYFFQLVAKNSFGQSQSPLIAAEVLPVTAPQQIETSVFTSGLVEVDWGGVLGAFDYVVRLTTVAQPGTVLEEIVVPANETSTTVSGLELGINYQITITARNSSGEAASAPVPVAISDQFPSVPVDFSAYRASAQRVIFRWTDTLRETSYQLRALHAVYLPYLIDLPANATTYTLNANWEFESYQFELVARNSLGSSLSPLIAAEVVSVTAPQNVVATLRSATSIDVTWDAVWGAFDYVVQVTTLAEPGNVKKEVVVNAPAALAVVTGLAQRSDYQIKVIARNNVNEAGSIPVSIETSSQIPTTPNDFSAYIASANRIVFQWTDTLRETAYQIQAFHADDAPFLIDIPANTTSYAHTANWDFESYQFQLVAKNSFGSTQSALISAEVPTVTAPQNVATTALSSNSLRVTWNAVSGAFDYVIRVAKSSTPDSVFKEVVVNSALTLGVVVGLQPGVEYLVKVTARNSASEASSTPVSVVIPDVPDVLPSVPTGFSAYIASPTSTVFTWIDGLREAAYELDAIQVIGNDTTIYSFLIPADSQTFTLPGTLPFSGFQFQLIAINAHGQVESPLISAEVLPVTAPQSVTATAQTSTSLKVQWSSVIGAWEYGIRIAKASQPDTALQEVTALGTQTSLVLSGLQAEVEYLITVTARNSGGAASHSPISLVLPRPPDTQLTVVPTITQATFTANQSIQLSWSAVAGATNYKVQQKRGKQWVTSIEVAAPTQSTVIQPDSQLRKLQIRIVAANSISSTISKPAKLKRPK